MKRSASILVASRNRLDQLEVASLEFHSSTSRLDLISRESQATEGNDETTSMEIDEVELGQDFGDESANEKLLRLPKSPKLAICIILDDKALVPKHLEPEHSVSSALYSWGTSHLLHDDDKERLIPEESIISKSERLGRLSDIISVACGPNHSACATKLGQVYMCGRNIDGSISPFEKELKLVVRPKLMESLGDRTIIRQVSCGWDHTAAVTSTGMVLTWGNNTMGQLGHNTGLSGADTAKVFCKPCMMALGQENQAASVVCGDQFTMVLTTRMSMLICGRPEIAGNGYLPRQIPLLMGLPIASLAAGRNHAVVLTIFGTAYAWGENSSGCCGRPFPKMIQSPVPMATASVEHIKTLIGPVQVPKYHKDSSLHLAEDVEAIHAACGGSHTVIVTRSGSLLVCGSNAHGQLGIANATIVEHLQVIHHPDSSRKFICAEANDYITLLLDDQGDAWEMQSGTMRQVLSRKNIAKIAAGGNHCIALSQGKGINNLIEDPHRILVNTYNADDFESLIKRLLEEPLQDSISSSGQELINRLEELLKYPSVMNSLFLDLSELDHLYSQIAAISNPTLQVAIASVTSRSIYAGLDSLRNASAPLKYAGTVRFLLHYIRFFDETQIYATVSDPCGKCISYLCETLLDLPFEGFKHLLAWINQYPPELFVRMLVKPLLSQLEKALHVDIDQDGVQHQRVISKAAPVIGSVLKWLHAAAETSSLASSSEFYCKAISKIPMETLYQDLRARKESVSKQTRHGFLLTDNPFLIPPSTKRDLLMVENQLNMVRTASLNPSSVNIEEGTITIDPFFVVEIEREHLLEQTLLCLSQAKPYELRKKLRIKFKDEEGIDAGGVTKEFFQLISEELFDVHSALWTQRFGDGVTWFNSDNTWDENGYEQVGLLVGLALYNNVLLDVRFPQALYRLLLNKPLGMEDLFDEDLKNGFRQLLEYEGDDVENVFCLTFEINWSCLGHGQKVELKENGANIPVTKENKEQYVLLYVKWILVDSISNQWKAFKKGVDAVLEGSSLSDLVTPEEMELLVVGSPDLDFDALEANTEYEGGYSKDSPVIINLWKFLKQADRQTKMQFLKFATGTCQAPIGGLGAMTFKVQRAGADSPQLPTSHTCFNTLLIPDYGSNYEKLAERLGRAILECEGFGLQ